MGAADEWKKPITFPGMTIGIDPALPGSDRSVVIMVIDDVASVSDLPADDWAIHMFAERLRWRLAWERDRTGVTVTNAEGAAP